MFELPPPSHSWLQSLYNWVVFHPLYTSHATATPGWRGPRWSVVGSEREEIGVFCVDPILDESQPWDVERSVYQSIVLVSTRQMSLGNTCTTVRGITLKRVHRQSTWRFNKGWYVTILQHLIPFSLNLKLPTSSKDNWIKSHPFKNITTFFCIGFNLKEKLSGNFPRITLQKKHRHKTPSYKVNLVLVVDVLAGISTPLKKACQGRSLDPASRSHACGSYGSAMGNSGVLIFFVGLMKKKTTGTTKKTHTSFSKKNGWGSWCSCE